MLVKGAPGGWYEDQVSNWDLDSVKRQLSGQGLLIMIRDQVETSLKAWMTDSLTFYPS